MDIGNTCWRHIWPNETVQGTELAKNTALTGGNMKDFAELKEDFRVNLIFQQFFWKFSTEHQFTEHLYG